MLLWPSPTSSSWYDVGGGGVAGMAGIAEMVSPALSLAGAIVAALFDLFNRLPAMLDLTISVPRCPLAGLVVKPAQKAVEEVYGTSL